MPRTARATRLTESGIIDGFRLDLDSASTGEGNSGRRVLGKPAAAGKSLAFDPILSRCKLIAEAWDAGGLNQVGTFPAYGRWAEWNGKYRDCVRRFLKGDEGLVGEMAQRLQGSPDLWGERGRTASIQFVTCHDGFTLNDLVSYNHKAATSPTAKGTGTAATTTTVGTAAPKGRRMTRASTA